MIAPRPSPARGPNPDITAPMIGLPIGVEPWKATNHSAITRPRMAGSARICSVALPTDMNTTEAPPTSAIATSSKPRSGASVAQVMAIAKANTATVSRCTPVRPRLASTNPLTTAPTPIAAVMKPYPEEPACRPLEAR